MNQTEYRDFIITRVKQSYSVSRPPILRQVEFSNIAQQIFSTDQLWESISRRRYLLSTTLKSFFIHQQGLDIDPKVYSVYWADIKNYLDRNYDIYPLIATSKQRDQIWDEPFVISALQLIQLRSENYRGNVNKTVYHLNPDLTPDQMVDINQLCISQIPIRRVHK